MPRPRAVTLLAAGLLLLAAWNVWGAVGAIRRYTLLSQLPLSLPPAYLLASSAVWAALFGLLAYGLWRLRPWARRGTLAAFTLYLALGWVERLVFGRSDYVRATLPFTLLVHALGLALVWSVLLWRRVRQAFAGGTGGYPDRTTG